MTDVNRILATTCFASRVYKLGWVHSWATKEKLLSRKYGGLPGKDGWLVSGCLIHTPVYRFLSLTYAWTMVHSFSLSTYTDSPRGSVLFKKRPSYLPYYMDYGGVFLNQIIPRSFLLIVSQSRFNKLFTLKTLNFIYLCYLMFLVTILGEICFGCALGQPSGKICFQYQWVL